MKIIFILLLCIFGLMPPSWAQSITKNDSILIERLLERANAEGISGSLAKGRAFADTALWLSKKQGYARGEGFAYLKIADLYKLQNEYEEVSPWL